MPTASLLRGWGGFCMGRQVLCEQCWVAGATQPTGLVGHQLASITVQGIPAPGYAFEDDKDPGDIPGFVAMIRAVNDCLRAKSLAAGFNFLDVHAATVGEDGRGNGRWHLDGYHLSPAFYRQAQDWLLIKSGSDFN
jgi:hypothetical protein